MEHERTALKVLMDKPQSKSPPGRPRRRWQDNINLKEITCERSCVDDAMHFQFPHSGQ